MRNQITSDEFEQLYRSTANELFAYLRRRKVREPEDVLAEVFATAWRRRADLPAPLLRRAWLFGTARKLLLADARTRGREHTALGFAARTDLRASAGVDEGVTDVVARALGRLEPAQRELIQLVEWERMTPSELAVVLGVRPGTARVRLHRARQALAADRELQGLVHRVALPVMSDASGEG